MKRAGSEGSASVLASEASHKSVGRVQRTALRTRRKGPPRRGRVIDKLYLAWIHAQPCVISFRAAHVCLGNLTAHHVRRFGEPKNDRRVLPLCSKGHLHGMSILSIEALGKRGFESYWGIDIEAEILELNAKYEEETHGNQN